jgi:hypothetical protein
MCSDVQIATLTGDLRPITLLTRVIATETVVHTAAHLATEAAMPLLFIGIDPNTGDHESPTIWVDQENEELVLQGWKPDANLEAECAAFELPGHATGIPENEAVVRIPARMVPLIREACDAVERANSVH